MESIGDSSHVQDAKSAPKTTVDLTINPQEPATPAKAPYPEPSAVPETNPVTPVPAPTARSTPAPASAQGISDLLTTKPLEFPPQAGPSSSTPAPPSVPRRSHRKTRPKAEGIISYTTAYVPGLYNIKHPAGDFGAKENNIDIIRSQSQARAKKEKADEEAERERLIAEGNSPPEVNPLDNILIIHPGSRNLRIGRASDFYPHEIPNCIARPVDVPNRGIDPPVPGSRAKRLAEEHGLLPSVSKRSRTNGHGRSRYEEENEDEWEDPVDTKIGYLREYLRNRLRQERLATDYKEGARVSAANSKAKAESIPEHNDPYRFDWTETHNRPFIIGTDALRLPESSKYRVRYPILRRGLNTRDWSSSQSLLDDISVIISESLRTELEILPKDYGKYSVVFIVPDHGDRVYVQEMTHLFLNVMGFKEIAVHQEAYCAIFSAAMSTACVVDIGAQQTSVTCVEDGVINADTRINLAYGGDDVTQALATILERSSFPYRELDLSRPQEWLMMDNLKIKICTLEEHMVANTPWDFYVLRSSGLTLKYNLRTYDENILAPLCFFDTRLIDFEEKKGEGSFSFRNQTNNISDLINSPYSQATAAMKSCTTQWVIAKPDQEGVAVGSEAAGVVIDDAASDVTSVTATATKPDLRNGASTTKSTTAQTTGTGKGAENGGQWTPIASTTATPLAVHGGQNAVSAASTPAPEQQPTGEAASSTSVGGGAGTGAGTGGTAAAATGAYQEEEVDDNYDVIDEASHTPLDGAITASISSVGTENKVKSAASSILLIGGGSALKGLGPFIADRLPPLLRAKGFPIQDVQIVPPPRGLNPRFVSWKGASVMCHLESLSDMWIRRDEYEALGARSLKDRCLFL